MWGCTEWVHHPENFSIKYHEQKFCIKFAFSGKHWAGLFTEKCKNFQFLGCLIKFEYWISVSESAKKPTTYDLLFLIVALYSSKNDNKYPSGMKNYHHSSYFTITKVFPSFGTHFDDRPKILTYCQISSNSFLLRNCPIKKVSQTQSNWFVFKRHRLIKEGCADMNRVKWARQQLRTVILWEFFFSKWQQKQRVFIWLQKISMKHFREL